jgi:catechol 2,3-dioxygenase-like lactoylglutathione lyase family enzyme
VANGSRRPIAPVRKLIAAVLGTVSTFVILFGLGMTSWSIVALGGALLALAIALVAVHGGGRAWVNGVAHVVSASEPPTAYAFGRCELQIVIDAPGLPPRSKKVIEPRVPVSKWPDVGQELPIKVALDDQRHVRILWDDVSTHAEAARAGAGRPSEFDDLDPLPEEVLIEQDAPPWAQRRPDDDFPMPAGGDPGAVDLTGGPREPREDPVVVGQTPGGTIVLEGILVEPPTRAPLPRRPQPGPGVRREPTRAAAGPTAGTSTTTATTTPAPTADSGPGTASATGTAPTATATATETATATGTAGTRTGEPEVDGPPVDLDPTGRPDEARAPFPGPVGPRSPDPARSPAAPQDDSDIDLDIDGPGYHDHEGPVTRPDDALLDELHQGPAAPVTRPDDALLTGLIDAPAPAGASAGSPGPIHGVGITVLVTNLDRSVAFYRDMLGFFEIDGGEGNAVLASGGTRLVLRAIADVAPINRRLVHLNLEVHDVEAVYGELKAKGVRFTYAPRAVNRGAKLELWAAAFRDPDGHGIALTQWRDRPTG